MCPNIKNPQRELVRSTAVLMSTSPKQEATEQRGKSANLKYEGNLEEIWRSDFYTLKAPFLQLKHLEFIHLSSNYSDVPTYLLSISMQGDEQAPTAGQIDVNIPPNWAVVNSC